MTQTTILRGALASGIINAIINGTINWFQLDTTSTIKLSTDIISSEEHTVFSGAVVLGTSLAFILTSITYFTLKIKNKPKFFPKVFLLALHHSVFFFGLIAIFAILFQRIFGSIAVSAEQAALVTGCIAGLAAGGVDYMTKIRLMNY